MGRAVAEGFIGATLEQKIYIEPTKSIPLSDTVRMVFKSVDSHKHCQTYLFDLMTRKAMACVMNC